MSVDTRTPRTPTGGRSPGFDDEPVLSSVKVPCDPAQVIVNHASFRVQLAAPAASGNAMADTARIPVVREPAGGRRRAPVVWSGRTEPGGTTAATSQLLHAVRMSGRTTVTADRSDDVGTTTQVLPRVRLDEEQPGTGPVPGAGTGAGMGTGTLTGPGGPAPAVVGQQRGPMDADTTLLKGVRPTTGAYDHYDEEPPYSDEEAAAYERYGDPAGRRGGDPAIRHAYYPGRRMNLGVVLLPLRVFLGLISVYAGMGKLCDPVYFDGGERGSMVKWLQSLHPWSLVAPLRDFALSHPVGAGLTVAFLQVVVGVLTMCGLWQRVAASFGALLSATLLMTVSWRTVPVYDAPDIIYLAAWSPLLIAGAPVYSMDARLAGEAWRRLGPRVELWDLRRRVLRRGAVLTAVVAGLTLLVGSLLGGAVRSASVPSVPKPGEPATNNLPGSPLPQQSRPGGPKAQHGPGHPGKSPKHPGKPSADASRKAGAPKSKTPSASAPGTARATGSVSGSAPDSGRSSGRTPARQNVPTRAPATTPQAPSVGGTAGGTNGGASEGGSSSSSSGRGRGGTLGGLLG
ncbi:DoxX family membrane protein [Streptomyces chrestomyceticus]|uniref:DoxX family protein n=1 Tax=Streptomyces chrestomyceticus TaxID=68185 RepID=UPI0019D12210|nr:DoxX family protein [Streptomyces chrestomyceticus]